MASGLEKLPKGSSFSKDLGGIDTSAASYVRPGVAEQSILPALMQMGLDTYKGAVKNDVQTDVEAQMKGQVDAWLNQSQNNDDATALGELLSASRDELNVKGLEPTEADKQVVTGLYKDFISKKKAVDQGNWSIARFNTTVEAKLKEYMNKYPHLTQEIRQASASALGYDVTGADIQYAWDLAQQRMKDEAKGDERLMSQAETMIKQFNLGTFSELNSIGPAAFIQKYAQVQQDSQNLALTLNKVQGGETISKIQAGEALTKASAQVFSNLNSTLEKVSGIKGFNITQLEETAKTNPELYSQMLGRAKAMLNDYKNQFAPLGMAAGSDRYNIFVNRMDNMDKLLTDAIKDPSLLKGLDNKFSYEDYTTLEGFRVQYPELAGFFTISDKYGLFNAPTLTASVQNTPQWRGFLEAMGRGEAPRTGDPVRDQATVGMIQDVAEGLISRTEDPVAKQYYMQAMSSLSDYASRKGNLTSKEVAGIYSTLANPQAIPLIDELERNHVDVVTLRDLGLKSIQSSIGALADIAEKNGLELEISPNGNVLTRPAKPIAGDNPVAASARIRTAQEKARLISNDIATVVKGIAHIENRTDYIPFRKEIFGLIGLGGTNKAMDVDPQKASKLQQLLKRRDSISTEFTVDRPVDTTPNPGNRTAAEAFRN